MKKILCPGEALVDFVATETKPLIVSDKFLKKAGGAPANAAGAIAKFRVESYFLGTVGEDPFGMFLKSEMEKFNINTKYLSTTKEVFTTMAYVSIDETGDRDFIFNRGADEKLDTEVSIINDFDCVHFSSATAFLGGELELSYFRLLKEAHLRGKLISFDANYREALFADKKEEFIEKSKQFIGLSDIVKLSEEEALLISGMKGIDEAGKYILSLGCQFLTITLGSKGSKLFTADQISKVEAIKVDVVDTTGAGDAFIGSLVAQAVQEEELTIDVMTRIVELSSKIGSLTTTKFGALESIPSVEEVVAHTTNMAFNEKMGKYSMN